MVLFLYKQEKSKPEEAKFLNILRVSIKCKKSRHKRKDADAAKRAEKIKKRAKFLGETDTAM